MSLYDHHVMLYNAGMPRDKGSSANIFPDGMGMDGVSGINCAPVPDESEIVDKCDELFRWSQHIWKKAWKLGPNFSVDEQTAGMQGGSKYNTRCGKYIPIGDGIQVDDIADDGFTYSFYWRNEPPPKKWIDMGFCPLHARCLHMFENMEDIGHRCKMDNLYNSVKYAGEAYDLHQMVEDLMTIQWSLLR